MTQDRYRYYRVEAEELVSGLMSGVLELERSGATAESVRKLLRFAHTLKGASRVVKLGEVAEHAHAMEDLLAPLRDAGDGAKPERSAIEKMLAELDAMRATLRSLVPAAADADIDLRQSSASPQSASVAQPTPAQSAGPQAASDESLNSVRVELGELDELVRSVARLGGIVDRLDAIDGTGEKTRAREELEREIDELRERVGRLRLLPAEVVFADVRRAVRDTATALGKQVEVEFAGGEIRLDAHVLGAVRGALLHVVRNAVAHGIEHPTQRAGAGKSATGRITFAAARVGHRAVFSCGDDGRGIDAPAIKEAAARSGVVTAEAARALGQNELIELLLQGGVSTSRDVTEISGRGVGLETLRHAAKQLKGDVSITSTPGRGTRVELSVPISLSSMPVLAVHAGGAAVLIPLDAVVGIVTVASASVCATSTGETLLWKESAVPFVPLAILVGGEASAASRRPRQAVVVRGAKGEMAVGVDNVLDVREIVLQALPRHAKADPVVAGVAFDVANIPRIVIAPDALDATVSSASTPATERQATLPVLVIDDSLTTRMLEQTILEAAGYEVALAVSAEDGLAKAAAGHYGLFIVDVEMPGMTGFEFVARTRADPKLAGVPCIMVTSRNSAEDRRRGIEAGAAAYFDKGQFDQDALLESIRGLLG